MTIDVWAQHPTQRFLAHDMFASLRRWTGDTIPTGDIPLTVTSDAMDAAGVDQALISAWHAPDGVLISNDEVAAWAAEATERLFPLASVDLRRPMEAVRELRRRAGQGFKGLRVLPWLWELPPKGVVRYELPDDLPAARARRARCSRPRRRDTRAVSGRQRASCVRAAGVT